MWCVQERIEVCIALVRKPEGKEAIGETQT
jgi:hypothetical protein